MVVTHFIVEIMSVMIPMPTPEYGGTVMMMKPPRLEIFQKVYILYRVTKK